MKTVQRFLVGLTTLLALGAQAQAQGGGQGGDPAMAGMGRMVRGTVTAATPDKLTVKTEAGDLYQVALTPNTRVMKDRQQIKPAEVHVGDGLGAMGEIDQPNKTVHAMFVTVVDAEQLKKAREAMGKTYIAGKVTAIDELKLTILRADGVSQVIAVDEDTSFRKGGRGMQMAFAGAGAGGTPPTAAPPTTGADAITLADVKVGDNVAGPGKLKNGVFVPTTLGVGEPGQGGGGQGGGRRRRQQGDGTGAPAGTPATPPPTPNVELN